MCNNLYREELLYSTLVSGPRKWAFTVVTARLRTLPPLQCFSTLHQSVTLRTFWKIGGGVFLIVTGLGEVLCGPGTMQVPPRRGQPGKTKNCLFDFLTVPQNIPVGEIPFTDYLSQEPNSILLVKCFWYSFGIR